MLNKNGHGQKQAVLYARVSTDEQARTGYSLSQQLEALRGYATLEGLEILEEVIDRGQSGASLERPGMDKVRDLVAAGSVSVVLAQDRDRFSRVPAYHYLLRREFEEYGTGLKALNDRGDGSPEGEWVDAARGGLENNRRPANAGRREWELSGGILRCAECDRAMSARSYSKPARYYFYYCCSAGGYNKPHICSARTHHQAQDLETSVWKEVAEILKDPTRLRAGLDRMIEQEARGTHGDPAAEAEWWLEQHSEADSKRARYQEMAAEGLIKFSELRVRLTTLEETRKIAE